jgi:putative lipoprotein
VVEVDLVDVSSGVPAVIATTQVNAEGQQVPVPFDLTFDPALIDPAGTYLANGRIICRRPATLRFSGRRVLVLTNGAPATDVEIVVQSGSGRNPGG